MDDVRGRDLGGCELSVIEGVGAVTDPVGGLIEEPGRGYGQEQVLIERMEDTVRSEYELSYVRGGPRRKYPTLISVLWRWLMPAFQELHSTLNKKDNPPIFSSLLILIKILYLALRRKAKGKESADNLRMFHVFLFLSENHHVYKLYLYRPSHLVALL